MIRNLIVLLLGTGLTAVLMGQPASARGFGGGGGGFRGGGFGGGGGFRGGGFGGGGFRGGEMGGMRYGGGEMGGMRYGGGEMGGMRYGGAEGFRGGYGGTSSFSRTPSFSSAGTYERAGGEFRGYNPYAGGMSSAGRSAVQRPYGGRAESGYRTGSYTTQRGTTVDYGAAGRAAVGPGGGAAARGVGGVQVTTPGGRSFTDVGRAGAAVGPGGNAVAGRSNIAAASGPRGTAVAGSRSVAAAGPGGVAVAGSRGGVAVGAGGGAAGYRAYGAAGFRPHGYNAYGAYHSGWVHGYWNGHNDAAWAWRGGYWGGWGGWGWGAGLGMGLGFGLASWGFGSALYGMGYLPYANPYYGASTVVVEQPVAVMPYDYSQPIDTTSAPASESVADPAMTSFEGARESFKQGEYDQALAQANEALAKVPDDTAIHEFRALCLFALKRYDEAAATLYAVLSVGPGWDWSTLVGLYADVGVYTAQLRTLEDYCGTHPQSASARFVLAYHYLTEGYTGSAVVMLKQVVALMPSDTLSARLLRQLDSPKDQGGTATAPGAATSSDPAPGTTPAPADTTPPQGASIAGTWNAHPAADTSVSLTIEPGDKFTWKVVQKGKTQQFSGVSTYGEGILTLAQEKGPVLVGRVSWKDAGHLTFRVVGDGPDDPGLSFAKG